MVEFFDHTADVGLRVKAPDVPTLLAEAGQALFALMVAHPETVAARETRSLSVTGDQIDYLFRDWLAELLYLFESAAWVGREIAITLADGQLAAQIRGEAYDEARHGRGNEVKAVTYHGLRVERDNEQWLAEVILDI